MKIVGLRHIIIAKFNFNSDNTKSNLISFEKTVLKALKSNDIILIKYEEKGGQIVVLDKKKIIY